MRDLISLVEFLGKENVEEIKKAITEEIIDNVREAIREEYLLLPTDIQEEFKNVCKEESDKILKGYRKDIREELQKKYEEWIKEIGGVE